MNIEILGKKVLGQNGFCLSKEKMKDGIFEEQLEKIISYAEAKISQIKAKPCHPFPITGKLAELQTGHTFPTHPGQGKQSLQTDKALFFISKYSIQIKCRRDQADTCSTVNAPCGRCYGRYIKERIYHIAKPCFCKNPFLFFPVQCLYFLFNKRFYLQIL